MRTPPLPTLFAVIALTGCASSRAATPAAPDARPAGSASSTPAEAQRDGLALLFAADADYQHGKVDAAHPKAVRAVELLLPTGDVRAASALQLVGHWYLAHMDCARATASYEQARALRERVLGQNHPLVGISVGSLAEARRCAGDEEGAIALYQRSYEIMAANPSYLQDRVDMATRLAVLLEKRGDLPRAEKLLRDTAATVESTRGRTDPLYFELFGPLDSVLRAQGAKEAAEELWAGLPIRDYCTPEPCPDGGSVPRAVSATATPATAPARSVPATPTGQVADAAGVVGGLRSSFKACYDAALGRDARMLGRLEINLRIDASGAVSAVTAHRLGYLDDTTTTCVFDAIKQAHFQPPAGGRAVIQVPVTFVPHAR